MGDLRIKPFLWIILLALFAAGCSSSKTLEPLNIDSAVSRKNAIIIFNIEFEDSYLDVETEKEATLESSDLLKNKKLVEERRLSSDEKGLKKPLYFIGNIKATFSSTDKKFKIERFGNHLNSYEDIGIYSVNPGKYSLEEFEMTQFRFDQKKHQDRGERWVPFQEYFNEKINNWNFQAGKIYYLGDLKFNFRTQRFMFGIFPREQIVAKTRVRKVELKDNFEEVKKELKENYAWFPADKIINISENKKWAYLNSEEKEKIEEEKEAVRKEEKKIKERETRDKEKYFF